MVQRIINRRMVNRSMFAMGLCLLSSPAFSQVGAIRESTFHPTKVSAEIKPLPLALAAVPGVASVGAGAELSASGNAATFVDAYLIDANLPNGLRNQAREDSVPVIQKMKGYSADAGVRYYSHVQNMDSWYGGGKVGYGLTMGQWGYQGEKVNQTVRNVTPGVEAGYRWNWSNNMLFRLGAGIDGNVVQENSTSPVETASLVTADAEDKVKGYAQVAVMPRLDMGLGYTF